MPNKKKTAAVADFPEPGKASEALDIPFRDGVVTVPRAKGKWPTRAVLALQRNERLEAVELVLGPAQWGHVIDSEVDEFTTFLEAFADKVFEEVFNA